MPTASATEEALPQSGGTEPLLMQDEAEKAVGAADTLVRNTHTTVACRAAPAAEEDWSTPRGIVCGGESL